MQYIFSEPGDYAFRDVDGHHGKVFGTASDKTEHLIIECDKELTVSLTQQDVEFNYFVLEGEGHFLINDEKKPIKAGNLIVLPPGTKFSFGGKLKMLLINTPHWSEELEEKEPR